MPGLSAPTLDDRVRDCMMAGRQAGPDSCAPSRRFAASAGSAFVDEKMPGVATGVVYGQFERTDELNARLRDRVRADAPLRPNHAPRSVPTRQVLLPTADARPPAAEGFRRYDDYSPATNHASITSRGPPREFLANIDTETMLRGHVHALQRGAEQAAYVPSSRSELYHDAVPAGAGTGGAQPFPQLWESAEFAPNARARNAAGLGGDRFNNSSRAQMAAAAPPAYY